MRKSSLLVPALIVVCTIAYGIAQHLVDERMKLATVTAYNRSATGASVFVEWMNRVRPNSAKISRNAILKDADLERVGGLAIFSPGRSFSKEEIKIIERFVRRGGKLLLSFHSEMTFSPFAPLFDAFELKPATGEDERFKNGETASASPAQDSPLFKARESYVFYGARTFKGGECDKNRFDCYVLQRKIGEGEAVVVAGLPVVGNVLIDKGDNSRAALRIGEWAPTVLVDEYRHFFSDEKTMADLVRRPAFIVPLLGFICTLLLFFSFGYTEFHQKSLERDAHGAIQSHHLLNEALVQKAMDQPSGLRGALERHAGYLKRRYPREMATVEKLVRSWDAQSEQPMDQNALLEEGRKLAALHSKILKQKRRF